jgi:Flp pilus assembly protein TadD
MHPRPALFISILLGLVTLVIFWPVTSHEFVNFDDGLYVTDNPWVQQGLTLKGVVWALGSCHASNWHPLVWLSHMLDCSLFGMFAGGHHLTNLLFHVANTILLFLFLHRVTGALWRSGLVAALFAWHPLHVESVAWVAERKDLLSTLFLILSLWAYVRYVERPHWRRYCMPLLLFALGLMCKPMLVTLPFVLLLLDVWPLRRIQFPTPTSGQRAEVGKETLISPWRAHWWNLLKEKWPFFILSTLSCAITVCAQQHGGAIKDLETTSLALRLTNAVATYGLYLGKAIWPVDLAILYPLAGQPPLLEAVCSALILAAVSVFACWTLRQRPAVAVGWLWYLGTLIPVIGLVQVGAQAMADRYTYVPLIGVFIAAVWAVGDWRPQWRIGRWCKNTLAGGALAGFALVTGKQLQYWQNGVTLFEHATRITKDNYIAHNNLGTALSHQGRTAEAIVEFTQALRVYPNYTKAHFNLATDLASQGQSTQAIAHLTEVLRLAPAEAEAHNNLGVMLAQQGQIEAAMEHFVTAIRLKPSYLKSHLNLAAAYAETGRFEEAVVAGQGALELASAHGRKDLVSEIQNRLQFYSAGRPYHERQ